MLKASLGTALLLAVAAAMFASPAQAASVAIEGDQLVFRGGPEDQGVRVAPRPAPEAGFDVSDSVAVGDGELTLGAGCTRDDPRDDWRAVCAGAGVTSVLVLLGEGTNRAVVFVAVPARVVGGGGADRVEGYIGFNADLQQVRRGPMTFEGGAGSDHLEGSDSNSANDTLIGGPGADEIRGGGGDDVIDARDGIKDVVVCGDGRDTADGDPVDQRTGCEAGNLAPVARPKITDWSRGRFLTRQGRLRVRLTCAKTDCRGSVRLVGIGTDSKRGTLIHVPTGSYATLDFAKGTTLKLALRLPAKVRKRVGRREIEDVYLIVRTHDSHGTKQYTKLAS